MNYRGGMWEAGDGQDGVEWGGEWDNRNSIINKYIKKKKKRRVLWFLSWLTLRLFFLEDVWMIALQPPAFPNGQYFWMGRESTEKLTWSQASRFLPAIARPHSPLLQHFYDIINFQKAIWLLLHRLKECAFHNEWHMASNSSSLACFNKMNLYIN